MNKIGEIIEIKPILKLYKNEIGSATQGNICKYLNCCKGEVYVVFDDKENIQQGALCKIKEDIYSHSDNTLKAFSKEDYKDNEKGFNGNAFVYLNNYKYIMRLN